MVLQDDEPNFGWDGYGPHHYVSAILQFGLAFVLQRVMQTVCLCVWRVWGWV